MGLKTRSALMPPLWPPNKASANSELMHFWLFTCRRHCCSAEADSTGSVWKSETCWHHIVLCVSPSGLVSSSWTPCEVQPGRLWWKLWESECLLLHLMAFTYKDFTEDARGSILLLFLIQSSSGSQPFSYALTDKWLFPLRLFYLNTWRDKSVQYLTRKWQSL